MSAPTEPSKVTFQAFYDFVTENRERLENEKSKGKRANRSCPLDCPYRRGCRNCYMQHCVAVSINNKREKYSFIRKMARTIPFLRKPVAFVRFELNALGIMAFGTCPMQSRNSIDYLAEYALVNENLSDEASKKIYALRLMANVSSAHSYCMTAYSLSGPQYFDSCMPYTEEECFVDCGAFTGDTLQDFVQSVGKPKRYFAFEPDVKNRAILENNVREAGLQDRVTVYPYGAYDKTARMAFKSHGSGSTIVDGEGDFSIDVVCLDDVINEPVTTIKMDIEGAELPALKGARRLIEEYHPKLAICIYHSVEDLWQIASYIMKEFPSYTHFYVRHHGGWTSETVLYAY